jgi:hypothetical protein
MRSTVGVKLLLLLLAVSFTKVSSRIGVSWADDVEPRRLRSVDDLSSEVFEVLRQVHEKGIGGSLQIPHVARRIHKIVVEGSADEGEDFDHHARGRALKALNDGSDRLVKAIFAQEKELTRRSLGSGDSRELKKSGKQIVAIGIFTAVIIFFVFLIITNLINGATGSAIIPFFAVDNAFVTGTPGLSFKQVTPCERLPLQQTPNRGGKVPLFSYLPITQGLVGNILDLGSNIGFDSTATVDFFRSLLDINGVLENEDNIPNSDTCLAVTTDATAPECVVTAECCKEEGFVVNCNAVKKRCEKAELANVPGGFSLEPFCLMWSKTDSGTTIDTLGFVPSSPWPPIKPIPLVSVLPLCPIPLNPFKAIPPEDDSLEGTTVDCKFCDFYFGFDLADFAIGPVKFKVTIQFSGVAFSWADEAKLAFGVNAGTADRIPFWDGFRNQVRSTSRVTFCVHCGHELTRNQSLSLISFRYN